MDSSGIWLFAWCRLRSGGRLHVALCALASRWRALGGLRQKLLPLFALAAFGVFSSPFAAAQGNSEPPLRAEVNAPVRNFRLPVFDEQGNRQWDLQGAQALYVNRNEIRVDDMTLRTYGKDDPLNPRMLIQSPSAEILPVDNVAKGPGYLYITEANNNYFIIGRNWLWDGRGQKVSIKSDVRVTFRERLDTIMD